jgi:hypothetical protein
MGSTSYDEARDPADPSWAGASWYGPTTGEYWIVNPREYADPRKHGPGYLGRRPGDARRAPEVEEPIVDDQDDPAPEDPADPRRAGFHTPGAAARPREPEPDRPTSRAADATTEHAGARAWERPPRPAGSAAAMDPRLEREPGEAGGPDGPPGEIGAALSAALAAGGSDPVRRLGLVLLAWPPLGLIVASAIGDVTGCSRYAATCDQADSLLPWLAQALILGMLLLVPPIARIFATGSVALLAALVPVTAVLIVLGGGRSAEGPAVLAVLVFVAWGIGILYGLRQSVRRRGTQSASP